MEQDSRPTPFVIVADVRTGSTVLATTLDEHPQIRCRGELFHWEDFPDNQVPSGPRQDLAAEPLIREALDDRSARAAGFQAMVFHPDPGASPQWAGAWDVLAAYPGLRVIFLRRRDALAQFASLAIAQQTGRFNPSPGDPLFDPEHRPRVRIDPDELRHWIGERAALYAECRRCLQRHPTLDLDYEDLAADWDGTITQIEDFLGVDHRPLPAAKPKQEHRPLHEAVINYDEVAAVAYRSAEAESITDEHR